MSTANLDAADLAAVQVDGLINEEVMQRIWNITRRPLPLTDRIGTASIGNARFSWTQDEQSTPVIDGQKVDGSDTIGDDDTATGARVQNFAEIRTKTLKVSTRARDSNTIGFSDTLAYQVAMRQVDLKQDVEATKLSNNSSQADDGNTTPGRTGALDAWLETNTANGLTGSDGGFNFTTGLVDSYTPGTPRALDEKVFKDVMSSVYRATAGEPVFLMMRPEVTRIFSEYQFTAGARVAALTRETAGDARSPSSSQTAINVWIGDFATVEIVPNVFQPEVSAGVSTMFIINPALIEEVVLTGYRVDELRKDGLADNRHVMYDWGLRVGNEAGCGAFRDIDETLDMVTG